MLRSGIGSWARRRASETKFGCGLSCFAVLFVALRFWRFACMHTVYVILVFLASTWPSQYYGDVLIVLDEAEAWTL